MERNMAHEMEAGLIACRVHRACRGLCNEGRVWGSIMLQF